MKSIFIALFVLTFSYAGNLIAADTKDSGPVCVDGLTCFANVSKCVSDADFVQGQGYAAHAKYTLNTEVVCVAGTGNPTRFFKNTLQSISVFGWENDTNSSRATSIKKCESDLEELKAGYGPCSK